MFWILQYFFIYTRMTNIFYQYAGGICLEEEPKIVQGGPKKSLWCDLEEKCLWNSEIFFDGVFLSIYSHLLKKLELSKLNRKKLWGSKNPENGLFQKSHLVKKDTYFLVLFLFLLQDNSYSCLVLKFQFYKLKIPIEVIKLTMRPQKCLFSKCL